MSASAFNGSDSVGVVDDKVAVPALAATAASSQSRRRLRPREDARESAACEEEGDDDDEAIVFLPLADSVASDFAFSSTFD